MMLGTYRIGFGIKSAVLFALIFLLNACDQTTLSDHKISHSSTAHLDRQHLVRGINSELIFDPNAVQNLDQMALIYDLYEGLTAYDSAGNTQPALAEHWESEDYKTWFFILRENAQWSNGEHLKAADFVNAWQALAKSDSPLKSYLTFIHLHNANLVFQQQRPAQELGIEAIDDRILRIQLDKPTPDLPQMLAHFALFPRYVGNVENSETFVSNGAYRLVEQQNSSVLLEQNPFYWQKARVSFKTVRYQHLANSSKSAVDFIWFPQQNASHYFPQLCTYYYEFNLRHKLLAKVAVRKALTSMISSHAIAKNQPKMTALSQLLPSNLQKGTPLAWENVVVEQLLAQNGITEKEPLQLKLTYDRGEIHQQVSEQMLRMWGQSDLLRIRGEMVSYEQLLAQRAKGEFDIIRSGWCADYNAPSAFLNVFHSANIDNKINYQNAEFDQLLEQALQPQSAEQREKNYAQLEQILQQDYVVLPLFQHNIPSFIHASLAGYQTTNPTGIIYSKDLYRKVTAHY